MDEKTQGLILKVIDYKDADKLASIFTFEYGVVTAKFVGVKKEKAKLKAVAQPFTFADFNFTTKANNKVVSGANIIDNFYQIMTNYNKTICGYIVLELLKSTLLENKPEADLFLLAISTLKNIEQGSEYVAIIDFILKFLNFSGFAVEIPIADYIYFNKETGDFTLNKQPGSILIDKKVYSVLNKILRTETIIENDNTLKQCLRLLHNIIQARFGIEINSFQFI